MTGEIKLGKLRRLAMAGEVWRTGDAPFQGENPGSIPGGDAIAPRTSLPRY
jgi:hypothetical protein